MYLIGLTGSIGMGKSATATLFQEAGVPVYDADAAVHALYEKGGAAVAPVGDLVPEAIVDGAVDRAVLGQHVLRDGAKLKVLEAIVHPLAGQSQFDFLAQAQAIVNAWARISPNLKRQCRLIEQHAKTINRNKSNLLRLAQKFCVSRRINNIADQRSFF